MNSRPSRNETIAYSAAFLIALALRITLLGKLPLTDAEATLALQALDISQGARPALASNVAYINISAILFFVFGSTNFLARLLPALAGSFLPLVPALFRDRLKARPALILAFFLAIDPALVALSRQAGSSILALTFVLVAAGFFLHGRSVLAGIFAALALLSGPALWPGLLGLLLAWMLSQFMSARTQGEAGADTSKENPSEAAPASETTLADSGSPSTDYRSLLTTLIATLLVVSSLLLLAPQGLGAWMGSLPAYIRGWAMPSSVPSSRMFLAVGAYQFFGVIFALIAIVRGWWDGSQRIIRLSLWGIVAFLLVIFYPARQPADLIWLLVPLWALAALEISRHIRVFPEDRLETAGVVLFTIVLLAFAWVDLNAMYYTPFPSPQANTRLGLFIGAILLMIASVVLVGMGWSTTIARSGATWGVSILLGLYTLGAAWGATGLRSLIAAELWDSSPRIAQAGMLAQTADDISEWATGDPHNLQVLIQGIDSPALFWALRFHDPQPVTALDPASTPEMVITPLQQELQLGASYRGQDFNWRQYPSWETLSPYNVLRWITFREVPIANETIIFWARNDLFVDSE